ncbi:MAG: 3-deoxy-D-manno-octulosonic acid transferase [Bacteroidetes bacterium]|nr:3-deoxy-D-manno-octulosonic acid transferase [Bacteroidota bacterium]
MFIVYNIFVLFYVSAIRIAALFNPKARQWVNGRKNLLKNIQSALSSHKEKKKVAWFHCASLGEFEQGRPILEAFKLSRPDHRIVLTFFSPSGFEIRKNYPGADHVFYLPADTRANVKEFIRLLSPSIVFFIKYEYWYNYIAELKKKNIPVYMVSAIFRPSQPFFRWYGGWFRKQLDNLAWFFVQDRDSEALLQKIGISKVTVSGDTRFDRVQAVAEQNRPVELMEEFCRNSKVLLAGSTWPEDETVILPFIHENNDKMKFVIAPHEVDKGRIDGLMSLIGTGGLRYSEANAQSIAEARVLVIDSIGILAFLYRYAHVSFIGGGFGVGIHNILESAAFGVPVIFGPNYLRFREACELIREGGAFSIGNKDEFKSALGNLLNNPGRHERASAICRTYVSANKGATSYILDHING